MVSTSFLFSAQVFFSILARVSKGHFRKRFSANSRTSVISSSVSFDFPPQFTVHLFLVFNLPSNFELDAEACAC